MCVWGVCTFTALQILICGLDFTLTLQFCTENLSYCSLKDITNHTSGCVSYLVNLQFLFIDYNFGTFKSGIKIQLMGSY
jgi:hypothetical protein